MVEIIHSGRIIHFVNIDTTGNFSDFGDLTSSQKSSYSAVSQSNNRSLCGGYDTGSNYTANCDKIIICDHQQEMQQILVIDLTAAKYNGGGIGDATRGLYMYWNPPGLKSM